MFSPVVSYPKTRLGIRLAATMSFCLGLFALIAWVLGIHVSFPFRSPIMMKTNTAIGLMALGVSVFAWTWPGQPAVRMLARSLAGFTCLLGLVTLGEHVLGVDLRIDQLIFTEPPGEIATASPNRMGPPSAICFLLLGFVLASLPAPRAPFIRVHWLAIVTLIIASIALSGHIFGAAELYTVAHVTGIAPHTALAFFVLSLATLCLRPELAPMNLFYQRDPGGEMARRLIPPAILLPPFVVLIITKGRDTGLYDAPIARVLLQGSLIVPLAVIIWLTACRLSRISQARDMAQRDFATVRDEAESLASRNIETMNLLDRMLDSAPVGFAAFDRQLRYVRVNRFLAATSNVSSNGHLGRTLREVYPEFADRLEPLLSRVFNEGLSIERFELVAPTRETSEERAFTCELFPIPDGRKLISMAGMVMVETTERKRLDEQKAAILESERAARAEAERAGLLKDEFLATLSHELRTPLTSIVGWSQILRRKIPEPADLQRGLETIDRNSKSLSQLINDLLDVSRIINGKLRLNTLVFNIQSIINAAVDSVAPSAETKGVYLVRGVESEPLAVNGDPSRLQQVVWNLLSNAVKFTPRGGTVQLSVRRVNHDVQIIVSDTGVGVKPEFLPHMFERFRQADSSTTRRFGGLGLGLSIVRQLTELHGGKVQVASDGVDRGATFTVTLPLAVRSEPGADDTNANTESAPDSGLLDSVRILIVDDEADTRNLIARVMEQSGAIVATAANVDDALRCVDLSCPHVLLSDIGMPERDGYELIRDLRRRHSAAELPAIALTAFARPEDGERSIQAGFQMHVRKPVDPQELVAAIASLLHRIDQPPLVP